jgi:tetratricopeptide (TPR) repeat protein
MGTLQELILTEMDRGDIKSAENFLKKAIEASPQNPDFDYLMARMFIIKNQFYLAEKKLNQVIKNNPSHINSLIALGELNLMEKHYDLAYRSFEKARLINSENPDVFIGLFKVSFYETIEKNGSDFNNAPDKINVFKDSINFLLNALEYDAQYVPANLLLGKIYTKFGECGKAKDYLEKVLKVSGDHNIARYYLGLCNPQENFENYKNLLAKNQNNEVIRYSYERNLAKYSQRRENKQLLEMAREHYEYGKGLFKSHLTHHGVFEMNWAAYLYPSFVDAHKELYQYYRSKKDYIKMANELNFLRKVTEDVTYQDLFEMLIEERKGKLYYREKIYRPEELKTPTPLYIFHFYPEDFLGNFPDAGEAISEKLHFALGETGRVKTLTGSQKAQLMSEVNSGVKGKSGVFYSSFLGKQILSYMQNIFTAETGYENEYVRYAVTGSYREMPDGLSVNAEIIDLETGITYAPFKSKAAGRGYIRDIVTKLGDHIYKNIPFQGQILKISNNGVIVNLGEREGILKDTVLGVYRNGKKLLELEITVLDMDILWANPVKFSDIYRLQPGDKIRIEKKQEEVKNSDGKNN